MRVIKCAFTAAVVVCLALASQPADAARPSAPGHAGSRGLISTVGSRIDSSNTIPGPKGGPPSGLPYRVLDQAIAAHAKADAARRAGQSHGPGSYARGDFSINVSPSNQTVVQGSSTTYAVGTQVLSGTPRTVSLSASGLPSGAGATFDPASVTAGQGSTLTIATTSVAAVGTFTLAVTGQYALPPTTHSITVSLTVVAAPTDDFAISASPSSQTVAQGSGTTYTVNTLVSSGTAQTVSLAVAGLPSGATGSFAPASVIAGGNSTLTVTTAPTTTTGTFALTITGVSSTATHTAGVSLAVTAGSTSGPHIGVSWNGQSEADLAPPDPK